MRLRDPGPARTTAIRLRRRGLAAETLARIFHAPLWTVLDWIADAADGPELLRDEAPPADVALGMELLGRPAA